MLEVRNLACERGDVRLFSGLEFSLGEGELLLVQGPNGSGKTSLLRLVAGLSRPAAGTIRWRGGPIAGLREAYSRELLFVGHANAGKEGVSADENLAISLELCGRRPSAAARAEALDPAGLAGLPHDGVLVIGDPSPRHKRRHVTLRIPASVLQRVHRRLSVVDSCAGRNARC